MNTFDATPRRWQPRNPVGTGWISRTGKSLPVPFSEDLRRIIELPYRSEIVAGSAEAEAVIDRMTKRFAKPPGPCGCRAIAEAAKRPVKPCITRLRLAQAWTLFELGITGGILGMIGVGHGKTLLDVLAPLAQRGCRTAVLLVPPKLAKQLAVDYLLIKEHFWVPEIVVHGGKPFSHKPAGASPDLPVLHVLPYSVIQQKEYTDWFERVLPDFVIADEAHRLRNPATATTSRVLRYYAAHRMTRFAGWTGTMTDQKISEYAHLAGLALGLGSPTPLDPTQIVHWSRGLHFDEEERCAAGALEILLEPGEQDLYEAFHRRLSQTEGVITTSETSVDVDIAIREREVGAIPPEVLHWLDHVRRTGERPDGQTLVTPMEKARCLREIASGFFYVWKFIHGETDEQIERWKLRRKNFFSELREKLKSRAEHLDSPLLCQYAAERYYGRRPQTKGLPVWKSIHWPGWDEVRFTVSPISVPIWISDFLARDCAAWARSNVGVVWYDCAAFGAMVAKLSGLPAFGAGADAGDELAALGSEITLGKRPPTSIIVSVPSHGTGTDGMQFVWKTQLLGQFPVGRLEQVLGRLHRVGQEDPVSAWFYAHTPECREAVETALARAAYVNGTTGSAQKILEGVDWLE